VSGKNAGAPQGSEDEGHYDLNASVHYAVLLSVLLAEPY
jgi:hypothetical protein